MRTAKRHHWLELSEDQILCGNYDGAELVSYKCKSPKTFQEAFEEDAAECDTLIKDFKRMYAQSALYTFLEAFDNSWVRRYVFEVSLPPRAVELVDAEIYPIRNPLSRRPR